MASGAAGSVTVAPRGATVACGVTGVLRGMRARPGSSRAPSRFACARGRGGEPGWVFLAGRAPRVAEGRRGCRTRAVLHRVCALTGRAGARGAWGWCARSSRWGREFGPRATFLALILFLTCCVIVSPSSWALGPFAPRPCPAAAIRPPFWRVAPRPDASIPRWSGLGLGWDCRRGGAARESTPCMRDSTASLPGPGAMYVRRILPRR